MTFVAAVVVLPVVMTVIAVGCGLLVERASGRRLPGALVLPLGFALMLVVANLPLTLPATAWLGPWLMLAASGTGWALGARKRRDRRPSAWAAAACGLVYV